MWNLFSSRQLLKYFVPVFFFATRVPLIVGLLLSSCSTPNYSQRDGPTDQVTDNALRYGSIGALGGAGFLAGKELGGTNTTGILGATIGVGGAYGLNKFFDHKREDAYHTGYADGLCSARAEIVNEQWKREAIYGLKDHSSQPDSSTYREVYVPSRVINNVKLQGEYQTVQLTK